MLIQKWPGRVFHGLKCNFLNILIFIMYLVAQVLFKSSDFWYERTVDLNVI